MNLCPLCNKTHEIDDCFEEYDTTIYRCQDFTCKIHESVFEGVSDIEKERRLNAIYNFVYEHPYADRNRTYWKFFYDKTNDTPDKSSSINVYHLMKNYPKDIKKRTEAILLALNKLYPNIADTFKIKDLYTNKPRLFYPECLNMNEEKLMKEFASIYSILSKLNYIELRISNKDINQNEYALTYEGLTKVDELKQSKTNSKKIFIAMSFDDKVEYIEKAFKEAISDAGFLPIIIKDKEHNNYIMPEIFYEIENSSAVVMDLTLPNCGAYYEAGYALGLKKQVIACCKEEVFKDPSKKPHFDIAQKSMIIWQDEEDLKEKLSKRIKYTVNIE